MTPRHHIIGAMRLTLRLEDDLYGVARSMARDEDITISEAVNRLLRRALEPRAPKVKWVQSIPDPRRLRKSDRLGERPPRARERALRQRGLGGRFP